MSPYQGLSHERKDRCSSRKFSFMVESLMSNDKSMMKSVRMSVFLLLGVVNARSNTWRIKIH
jgi:hypothetical protein